MKLNIYHIVRDHIDIIHRIHIVGNIVIDVHEIEHHQYHHHRVYHEVHRDWIPKVDPDRDQEEEEGPFLVKNDIIQIEEDREKDKKKEGKWNKL